MTDVVSVVSVVFATFAGGFALAELRALGARRVTETVHFEADRRRVIVRPLASGAAPPWLAEALASTFRAARSGDVVVFSVASVDDPASSIARVAIRRGLRVAPSVAAHLVVGGPSGPNGKVCRLAEALRRLPDILAISKNPRAPLVVIADDDVALRRRLLDALDAAVHAEVAAAWAAPVEDRPGLVRALGDRASAAILDGSAHAFPALGALPTGDAPTFVGKAFAIDADVLTTLGGFDALRNHLGEDAELSRRISAMGRKSALVEVPARSLAYGRTFREVVARYARWLAVVRAQRPHLLASYPLCLAPLPIVLGLAALAHTKPALVAAALAVLLRLLLSVRLHAYFARRRTIFRQFVDLFLADATLLSALVVTLGTRSHAWRGRTLVLRRGVIVESPQPHQLDAKLRPHRESSRGPSARTTSR